MSGGHSTGHAGQHYRRRWTLVSDDPVQDHSQGKRSSAVTVGADNKSTGGASIPMRSALKSRQLTSRLYCCNAADHTTPVCVLVYIGIY